MPTTRHLLIDGSNLLRAWPELKGLHGRDRDAAKAELTRRVAPIHDQEGARVTVVFDGSGKEIAVACPGAMPSFSIVTTPSGMTADDFIEQWIGKAAEPAHCEVATADVAQGRTVQALGGHWITPDDLAAWVKRAGGLVSTKIAGRIRDNDRKWTAK